MAIDRVYMDSNCFIEAIKSPADDSKSVHANDLWFIRQLLEASRNGDIEVVTSYITIAECRGIGGGKPPTAELRKTIRAVLESGRVVRLAQVTRATAELARELHWTHGINLSGADSLHVASAKVTGCREFVSLDFGKPKSPIKHATAIKSALGLSAVVPSKTLCLPFGYLQQPLKEQLLASDQT